MNPKKAKVESQEEGFHFFLLLSDKLETFFFLVCLSFLPTSIQTLRPREASNFFPRLLLILGLPFFLFAVHRFRLILTLMLHIDPIQSVLLNVSFV